VTRLNKSEWIRRQPATTPAKEVVAQAKAAGIKLSLAQVYTARSLSKKRGGTVGRPGRPRANSGAPALAATSAGNALRTQFVKIAMRIGTDEARALLERIEAMQATGRI